MVFARKDNGWIRIDSPGDRPVHCSGPEDKSPPHKMYWTRCGWCYLNIPHTTDAHNKSASSSMWTGRQT